MAHDYRLNPFTDTMDSVDITEYLIVPATSPYTIRTAEVPLKTTPSTIVIKEITSFSGSTPVYGRTFTEISATPSTSQFMPDYYTNAGGDENWNTGLILFNAADAGTMIEVSYKGTGTLVSVDESGWPAWMQDKGTGTSGNYNPTSNTTLAAGTYNFASVTIPAGVTVTCGGKVYIKCTGNFINNGTLTADGKGGNAGSPGAAMGAGTAGGNASGGGNGGAAGGGTGGPSGYPGGAGGVASYDISSPVIITGGGGGGGGGGTNEYGGYAGGAGGGAIIICAASILNYGTITARGQDGFSDASAISGGGGGGGGGIVIVAAKMIVAGSIFVNSGSGGYTQNPGQSGAAGRSIAALIR